MEDLIAVEKESSFQKGEGQIELLNDRYRGKKMGKLQDFK